MKRKIIHIPAGDRSMKVIVLSPSGPGDAASSPAKLLPGILWIHGGGYETGMAAMVYASCGKLLAKKYGAVVLSPGYRLSFLAPYPAAFEDCFRALAYMWEHAPELGIDRERIIVGGESAGGGLAAAVCLRARDEGKIRVAMQLPLYPMLDCEDTPTSRDNHGRVWNTKRNHAAWKRYLRKLYGTGDVPPYASPSRETNYGGLPPCYTYVCEGEPFFQETLTYVDNIRRAGGEAQADIYPGNIHAFDMLRPWKASSREAKKKLCEAYERVIMGSSGGERDE